MSFLVAHYVLLFFLRKPATEHYDLLARLWGCDTLAYMPLWYLWVFYVALVAACSPELQREVTLRVSDLRSSRGLHFITRHKALGFAATAFFFSLLFLLVRTHYWSLCPEPGQIARAMGGDFDTTKYLSGVFLYRFHKFLNFFLQVDFGKSLQLYDVCAGFLFVWLALLVGDDLGRGLLKKGVIALLTISSGSVLVFFGGYDMSVLGMVALLGYVYVGLRCIKEKFHVVVPLLLACFCALTDVRLLALLPSALTLVYFRHAKDRSGPSARTAKVLAAVVLIVLPLAYAVALLNGWVNVIPLVAPQDRSDLMTLFSLRHLWESLNAMVLLSGGAIFFLMILCYQALRGKVRFDAVSWFLGTITLFLLVVAFAVDSPRGSWDWPSFSFVALASLVMVGHYVTNIAPVQPSEPNSSSRSALPLTLFNILAVIPWLVVNSSALSVQKLENMVISDPAFYYRTTSRPYFELTLFCHQNHLKELAYAYARAAESLYPDDPRSYYNTAVLLTEDGRREEAEKILRTIIANFPQYPPAYWSIMKCYEEEARFTDALQMLDAFYVEFAKNPSLFQKTLGKDQIGKYLKQLEYEERNLRGNLAKADSMLVWIKNLGNVEGQ